MFFEGTGYIKLDYMVYHVSNHSLDEFRWNCSTHECSCAVLNAFNGRKLMRSCVARHATGPLIQEKNLLRKM